MEVTTVTATPRSIPTQRMAKLEPLASDGEHARPLGGVEDVPIDSEGAKRVDDRLHALRAARGGHQQSVAHLRRQT